MRDKRAIFHSVILAGVYDIKNLKYHHTGMDRLAVAEEIYAYTSGYPVLVSSICKCIDEELQDETEFDEFESPWSKKGIEKAVEPCGYCKPYI